MLVSNHYNITPLNIIPNVSNVKTQKYQTNFRGYNSDVFQANNQPSFTGLNSVLSGLEKHSFEGVSVYRQPPLRSRIILLDDAKKISEALDILSEKIKTLSKNKTIKLEIFTDQFKTYKHFIDHGLLPEIENISIKGIVGQGSSSTAFLTSDNKVIKLSRAPIFPSSKDFIEGMDAPIFRCFKARTLLHSVYGVIEPYLEPAILRGSFNMKESYKIINSNIAKLKEVNKSRGTKYRIQDFNWQQIGFDENGTYYFLDHQCIQNRPLVKTNISDIFKKKRT